MVLDSLGNESVILSVEFFSVHVVGETVKIIDQWVFSWGLGWRSGDLNQVTASGLPVGRNDQHVIGLPVLLDVGTQLFDRFPGTLVFFVDEVGTAVAEKVGWVWSRVGLEKFILFRAFNGYGFGSCAHCAGNRIGVG